MYSLRVRIAAAVALVSVLLVVAVGAVVAHRTQVEGRERLRDRTVAQLSNAVGIYRQFGLLRFDASVDPERPPAVLRTLAPQATATLYDGRTMWAVHRYSKRVVVSVALSDSELRRERATLLTSLAGAGAAAVPAAAVLGWLVGTGLSHRLRRGAATAKAISRGEPIRAHDPGRDEVAALTRAVDEMADALQARIEVEQAFTADVAHELRTPMTALVSSVELLPDDESAALVRNQVVRLRRLVDDLLEISRLESGQDDVHLERHDLAALVPGAVVRGSSGAVLAESRRVDRIVANLVGNAERHAGHPPQVFVEGTALVFEDDGPGFPEEVLRDGPRRFRRVGVGAGSGLGLTIARSQATAMGATLALENRPEGGARVVVTW